MKKSVAVLGLGKFGSSVARALTKGGAEVEPMKLSIQKKRWGQESPTIFLVEV